MNEYDLICIEEGERVAANVVAEEFPIATIHWRCFLARMQANGIGFGIKKADGFGILIPRLLQYG